MDKIKEVQPKSSPFRGEIVGKIHFTWNSGNKSCVF